MISMKQMFRLLINSGLVGLIITFGGPNTPTSMEAQSLPRLATVSGTVDSPKPFSAGKVYFRNVDKRMLYMVYTNKGRYEAMQLFPGNYELSVEATGLASEVKKITLKTGTNPPANVTLHELTTADKERRDDIEYQTFAEMYPSGPALPVVQRLCIRCHGDSFLPSKQWGADKWNGAIDYMMGRQIKPDELNQQDREIVLDYLVRNFGPASKKRALKVDTDMPVDEAKISKALYIEYYLPIDPPGSGVNDPQFARSAGPFTAHRQGQDPYFDSMGNVWFTDRATPTRLCKLDPRTGEIKEWRMPDPKGGLHDLTVDKNDTVWIAETNGMHLNAFNPKTETFERYDLNPNKNLPKPALGHYEAQSLSTDSLGNVWVGLIEGNSIAKWDRETKKITTYTLPTEDARPYGVIVDRNDNIWIAEFHGGKIAKFDTKSGKFTEYTPPTYPALIRRLTLDSKGKVWFGLWSAGRIERLDPATGKITEWKIPQQVSQPYSISADHQDNLWIGDFGQGGATIKFDPRSETFTYYPTPQSADQPRSQITREGAIWYCPRSSEKAPGVGVLYPDMTKITTLAAKF
jgi:virginiamycin B lyase